MPSPSRYLNDLSNYLGPHRINDACIGHQTLRSPNAGWRPTDRKKERGLRFLVSTRINGVFCVRAAKEGGKGKMSRGRKKGNGRRVSLSLYT